MESRFFSLRQERVCKSMDSLNCPLLGRKYRDILYMNTRLLKVTSMMGKDKVIVISNVTGKQRCITRM